MVLLLLPVVVFASGGATAIDFKGGSCTISADGAYTAAGDSGGKTITVESGVDAQLSISGLTIDSESGPAIYVETGATLELIVNGENTLSGSAGFAGICVEPAYDDSWNYDAYASAKLYISGSGTLSVNGGDGDPNDAFGGGAGIGSGYPYQNSDSVAFNISITDGASVRAYGGYHAQAIGYGYRPSSSTYYTGYGITLTLDDSIFLWAQNADYFQPALVAATAYDEGRVQVSYSSDNSIYLTHYVDADPNASSAALSTVPGWLNQPSAASDEAFDWVFDEDAGTVSIGPITVVDEVTGLNGNWATLCTVEPITIELAPIIIYVGGEGYKSVVTDQGGETVVTVSDGLPEPGFTIELPSSVDAALKAAVRHTGSGPLDLSGYLSFSYDDGAGVTRTWTLERYDNKEGNDSMAYGRYIYRIVPAEGQDKVRLEFTGEDGQTSTSDDFSIVLDDQYQVYSMTIYNGSLDPEHLKAVVAFPDKTTREFSLGVEPADLTIRGVVDDEDGTEPVTDVITDEPAAAPSDITAQVPAGTMFYINESRLEVEHWDAVKLLADKIIPAAEDILLERTYGDYSQITEEYSYEYRYLDLVDTSNGNVWVTANNPITVYWPYPEGTDADDEFYIVHYKGLDRQYDDDLADKDYETELFSVENGKLEKTEYGIRITVDSFSPFGLFWKAADDPTPPPVQTPTPTPTPTPEVPNTPPVVTDEPVTTPSPTDEPSAPAEMPAPTTPGVADDVPATGDTTQLGLWLALSAISLAGLASAALGLRKLQRGKRK